MVVGPFRAQILMDSQQSNSTETSGYKAEALARKLLVALINVLFLECLKFNHDV